jgi:alcohol dehydrogenase
VFSGIRENPTRQNKEDCAAFLRGAAADGVVALGGGSVLDCAKAAANGLPVIALPTTAGTGSEVTNIAVLSNGDAKTPEAKAEYLPKVAIVDPELTLSCPPRVTADSGMDALSHALEALWSSGHRPPCDSLARRAIELILENLETAVRDGADLPARSALAEGSLLAGMAFSQTRTAGVHACSFPLTARYGLSHGAACAFTLAAFTRRNGVTRPDLGLDFSALAKKIERLRGTLNLRIPQIPAHERPSLAEACLLLPQMQNNPVPLTAADIVEIMEEAFRGD